MKFQFLLLVLVTTSIPFILLPGCSGQNEVLVDQEQPATPESFSDAKSTWTKTEGMTERDTSRLMKYFTRNPSIAEHSIISGDPMIYSSGKKSHRYYWVHNGINNIEWMYLEFNSRGVKLREGQGDPFEEKETL